MAAELPSSVSDEMGPIAGINVTPFVDVVLVLLVIFMVTAPALVKEAIGLQLPKASSGAAQTLSPLGIAVTKQGQFLLNGQLLEAATLSEQVRDAVKSNPEVQALISADIEARHGDVVRAIDLVKTAGVSRFAIQIQRPE